MNEHVDYVAKPAKAGTKFLWWCAGADQKILENSSYSDHVKYVGIGGVVLATGFMAALSMGFAMQTIFHNTFVTVVIALIWALIVFNLDRFIVSSTGKGDGESSISLKELLNATPRLIMAILLGLTISAPLETQIFSVEIQRSLEDTKRNNIQVKIGQMESKLSILIHEKEEVKNQKKLKLESLEGQKKIYMDEVLAETNKVTCGPRCIAKKEQQRKFEEETYNPALLEFKKAEEEYNLALLKKEKELKAIDSLTMNEPTGFLDEILALEKLSTDEKTVSIKDPITKEVKIEKASESAFWPIWLVRLLFMIIEIAPVILKLMLIKSPYDYMGENVNQILEAKQGISLQHMTDEHSKIHKLKENFNPKRIIAVVEHQNKKEEENAKEAITQFAEKEKQEIIKNPESFIKPDKPTA